MAIFTLSSAAGLRPSWTRWLGVNEEEACAFLDALARRLHLAPEQHPLCDHFVQKMLKSISRAAVPVPGDGWDQGKSVALDHWLRLEIAAGCFLGAVEEARDSFRPRLRHPVTGSAALHRPSDHVPRNSA